METNSNGFAISRSAMLAAPALAQSATERQVRLMDDMTESRGETAVQNRIIAEFAGFAGSEANAQSLVYGLRYGRRITLFAAMRARRVSVTTFTPPTQPMGNGSVYLSLALAKDQLAAFGIASPTPQQLRAVLAGGTIAIGSRWKTAPLQGVLELRSQGMGWGRIAHVHGTGLGPIAAMMNLANQGIVTEQAVPDAGFSLTANALSSVIAHAQHRGIVTATGSGAAERWKAYRSRN